MKYNLKNRPDRDLIQPSLENWIYWAEGLERELREIHNDWSKGHFDWTPDYLTIRKLIKEILGE